jgi:hypothetical protein
MRYEYDATLILSNPPVVLASSTADAYFCSTRRTMPALAAVGDALWCGCQRIVLTAFSTHLLWAFTMCIHLPGAYGMPCTGVHAEKCLVGCSW